MGEPGSRTAGIAAADRELARLRKGIDRDSRVVFWLAAAVACIAAGLILIVVVVRPPPSRLGLTGCLVTVVLASAGGAVQARTIRSCRQEIRILRSGSLPED